MENKLTPELLEKAKQSKTPEELAALAKENGIELTSESAKAYFDSLNKAGGISDDELDCVAGGGCGEADGKEVNPWFCCEHFYCVKCHNDNPNCNLTRACCNCEHVWQSSDGTKTKCTYGAYDNVWWLPL